MLVVRLEPLLALDVIIFGEVEAIYPPLTRRAECVDGLGDENWRQREKMGKTR